MKCSFCNKNIGGKIVELRVTEHTLDCQATGAGRRLTTGAAVACSEHCMCLLLDDLADDKAKQEREV